MSALLPDAHGISPHAGLDALRLLQRDAPPEAYADLLARIDADPADDATRAARREAVQLALDVGARLTQHQQKERGLLAVIDTAQDLTALRGVDQVLQAIVRRARQLVGTDVGYLSIYDAQAGDFYVRATDGAFSDAFKSIRVPGAVGICGHVARHRAAYSSSNYEPDARFSHTPQIDHAVQGEGIRSILGVPLLLGDRVLGVLFVGDRYARHYVPWEVSILSTLASHASVAIENARLFGEAEAALAAAGEANARLQQQSADIQLAADTHEKLTALIARGGSLQDIVDMVAATLQGEVAVLDEGEAVLCASAGAAPLAEPERRRVQTALRESRVLGKSVAAFTEGGRVCRVAAVTGGSGLLGALLIVTRDELARVGIRTFERSALVTGIVLLSQERAAHAASGDTSALLRELLGRGARADGSTAMRLRQLGLEAAGPFSLAVLDAPPERHAYLLKRLRAGFRFAGTLIDEHEGNVLLLSTAPQPDALFVALRDFLAAGPAAATGVLAEPVRALDALPAAFQRARRALALQHALQRDGELAREAGLSLYASLFDSRDPAALDAFLDATLAPLPARLRATLLAYLDHGHNARATAQTLGIHVNTLRQRLDAIDAALGAGRLASRALELHMALRLWHLRVRDSP